MATDFIGNTVRIRYLTWHSSSVILEPDLMFGLLVSLMWEPSDLKTVF